MQVIKRDGKREVFDIAKIRKQIEPACRGTDIDPIRFESMFNMDIGAATKSSDIQERLVLIAKDNISDTEPDWDIVAGRLMAYQTQREVWKNTKTEATEFRDHVEYLIRNGYYRNDLKTMADSETLTKLGKYIKPSRDYNLRLSQIALLRSKYLVKNQKGVLEYPNTADMVNSVILASVEGEDVRLDVTKEYYDMLSTYVLSLATPFKANLRLPDGNTSSCFVGESGDSLAEIFKGYQDMAFISQEGGGLGWYLGKIRPSESYSARVPKSNKVNKWIKIINDIAVGVNQRGVRKGAITPALDWWHMDIIDFVEVKSELNGDLRDKCFDIFPQVVVDAHFVSRVLSDEYVYKFSQYEYKKLTGKDITEMVGEELLEAHQEVEALIEQGKIKQYEKVKAKTLWKKFLSVWIEYGDFYIAHKDNINFSNYLTTYYNAKCGNLCQESYSISKPTTESTTVLSNGRAKVTETDGLTHSCSLISINVANILDDDELLQRACHSAVRMLDASIDLGSMPVLEAEKSSQFLRNIGIGIVGLADYMAWNKVMYDTDEGRLLAEKLAEKIAYYCYNASIDLAIEKGSYPAYEIADYSKLFGRDPKELNEMSPNRFDWVEVQARVIEKGIRNMLLLAYAPNTSSGLVQGVTASYLPTHSKNNTQKLEGLIVPVLPKFIKERFWSYRTKFQYKASDIIKFTRVLQRWVDTGISMEVAINVDLCGIADISKEILEGFDRKELKTVYYSITIDGKKENCEGCAN